MERNEFGAFVGNMGERPTVQALEWIPRVPDAERAAFEETARQEGFAGFTFTERESQGNMVAAAARPEYFPVYFLEPRAGNEAALGFDLGSNATRLDALNQARDSGEMVATSRITLVQETGDQYGFLVFAPIYRNGAPRSTLAERRANLMGFGLGVFRIGSLVNATASNATPSANPIDIEIFDLSAPDESARLYPKSQPVDAGIDVRSHHRGTRTLDVAGREWLVVATPSAAFSAANATAWRPWAVLLTGLLFTVLVALYLKLIASRTREVERLVEERTARLTKVNKELEHQIAERRQA